MRTLNMVIFLIFALVGAAMLIYFVRSSLPDLAPEPIEKDDDCDDDTIVCVDGQDVPRCMAGGDISCFQPCPCPVIT